LRRLLRQLPAAIIVLAASAVSVGAQAPSPGACGPLPSPHVVVDEGNVLLQYWLVEDEPWFHDATVPSSIPLREFRGQISARYDTSPRALLEGQLPHVTGGDAQNVRLALSGEAGSIRTMSCLEGLLLATQAERSADQGRSMYTHPTEFLSYVLQRDGSMKVWYYTVDQPGVRGLATLHDPILEDLRAGWVVVSNIHNHNFFPDAERVLGGVVPSATDIQAARNMREALGLTRAVITNGFDSIEIAAADFDAFMGP
jgi:hypothetical protein